MKGAIKTKQDVGFLTTGASFLNADGSFLNEGASFLNTDGSFLNAGGSFLREGRGFTSEICNIFESGIGLNNILGTVRRYTSCGS